MSSSSSESDRSNTENVTQNQLSANYMRAYNNFILWKNERGENYFSEDLFVAYFEDLAKTNLPTSLWSMYSKLKTTLRVNNSFDIKSYTKLTGYLKQITKGYKPKKSKVFSRREIDTFLMETPDDDYLAIKVALIMGIQGGCRSCELVNLKLDNIEKHSEQLMLVKVEDKNKGERSFVVRDEYKHIVEKYMAQRPPDLDTDRFFIRYQNGKCFKQVIGKNQISAMPQKIASLLNLPDPKSYTGHCFRRTAIALSEGIQVGLPSMRRCEPDNYDAVREVFVAKPYEHEVAVEYDAISNSLAKTAKVEIPTPIYLSSLSPRPLVSEQRDRELSPPPPKKERVHELQTGRIKITESVNDSSDTKTISKPTKNITIIFENCTNVSNININF